MTGARQAAAPRRRIGSAEGAAAATTGTLLELLRDSEPLVRWAGVRLAESLPVLDEDLVAELEKLGASARTGGHRYEAGDAACMALEPLGRSPFPADDPDRRRADLGAPDRRKRLAAAAALSRRGTDAEKAVPVLVGLLDEAQNALEYEYAADALGRYGPDAAEAVPALRREVRGDDPRRRLAAAAALRRILPDEEEGLTARDGALYTLRDMLRTTRPRNGDQRQWYRGLLHRVGTLGPAAAPLAPDVAAMLEGLPDDLVREGLRALEEIGAEPEILVPALVARLPAPADLPPLPGLTIYRENVENGWTAADLGRSLPLLVLEMLARQGPAAAEALPALEELRRSEDDRIRYRAALAIRRIRSE